MTYIHPTKEEIEAAIRAVVAADPANKNNDISDFRFTVGRHCNEIHLDTYYCEDGFDSTQYRCILCNKHVSSTCNEDECTGFKQNKY